MEYKIHNAGFYMLKRSDLCGFYLTVNTCFCFSARRCSIEDLRAVRADSIIFVSDVFLTDDAQQYEIEFFDKNFKQFFLYRSASPEELFTRIVEPKEENNG